MIFEEQFYEFRREERIYSFKDLRYLSANISYSLSEPFKEFSFFDETIRFDSHKPFGNHINIEDWLNLKGKKEGRKKNIFNLHIPLDDENNDDKKE
jgi:hypothetical protein